MASIISFTPPTLDLSIDRYAAWSYCKDKWYDYIIVSGLDEKEIQIQCSTLRYTFTDETRRIYNTLQLSDEDKKDPEKIIKALEELARGIINETLESHAFNTRTQENVNVLMTS